MRLKIVKGWVEIEGIESLVIEDLVDVSYVQFSLPLNPGRRPY